ncbi:MAG: hypothetical protein HLX50_23725, partial [Alteromonadaceae bacterium]|nr:hypothetical protein [Alteromonadaceae bacterium]
MKQFKLLALVPAMLLAACVGDDEQAVEHKTTLDAVVYSFPEADHAHYSTATDNVINCYN